MSDLYTAVHYSDSQVPLRSVQRTGGFIRNGLAMSAANVLGRGLAYVYFILMARHLEARYIGMYAMLTTAAVLMELVSNLGLDKILIREISLGTVAEGQGYVRAALPIRFAVALLAAISAWALIIVLFQGLSLASPLRIAFFLMAIFPIVMARNYEALLTAHQRLVPIAISQLSERIVIFLAVLLLSSGYLSFADFLCVAPLAGMIRLTVVALSAMPLWNHKVSSTQPGFRLLLGQASQLFSVEVLAQAYFRSDVFLLAKMGGLSATGVYQITYKIFDCCLSLFAGFLQSAFPRLVRDSTGKSLKSILIWGSGLLSALAAIIIYGRMYILGAIKPEYISGSTSLIWLMLTVPLVYITSTLANAAIVAHQIRMLITLAAFLLVTNISLNVMLIPRWSINGAAFSTFACELMSAAFLSVRLRGTYRQARLEPAERSS